MNLIICTSPLQMLIAEKIIMKYSHDRFECIILSNIYNEKFDFYSKRLGDLCCSIYRLGTTSLSIKKIIKFLQLRKKTIFLKNHEYERIFIASIDDTIIYSLLDNLSFKALYTFDDGSINIINSGKFYRERPMLYNFLRKILGIKYSQEKIIKNSVCHYTIYPNRKNIISNLSTINLFDLTPVFFDSKEVISILLGQYIYDGDNENRELFIKVINAYNIKYLFPHPKMKLEFSNVENIEVIKTNLIFEEYIQQMGKGKKIKLYTFFSSAAMNVASYPNIDVIAIKLPQQTEEIIECYEILQSLGAELVELK